MKMIIVDDEEEIAESIKSMYDWSKLGIESVVCFNKSAETYEYICNNEVDIVLTDIKMPKISGLELSKRIIEKNPDIKIIIISGYDSFDYAQNAVRIGVCDYLLKPFRIEDLVASVKKAVVKITAEKKAKDERLQMYKIIMSNRESDKKIFFTDIEKLCAKDDIFDRVLDMGIKNPRAECVFVCISIIENSITAGNVWRSEDMEIIYFAMLNIIKEIMGIECLAYIFADRIECLFFGSRSFSAFKNKIRECIELINSKILIRCTVSISNSCKNIASIPSVYNETKKICAQMTFYEKDGVFDCYDKYEVKGDTFFKGMEKLILNGLFDNGGMDKNLKSEFEEYCSDVRCRLPKEDVINGYVHIIESVVERSKKIGIESLYNYSASEWKKKIERMTVFRDINKAFLETLTFFAAEVGNYKISDTEVSVLRAQKYIDENFDKDLSLDELSQKVNLSPGYLALKLKEKTGMSYSKYVNVKRMERAEYLLRNTEKKIKDVARLVGYNNQRYFVNVFKKYTGEKPTDYRLKNKKGKV